MKIAVILVVAFGIIGELELCFANETANEPATSSTNHINALLGKGKLEAVRIKRGYGHGGGGGGGGGHGGYGHGPGAGGGARGPVYFCGWVGSKEGSQGYGHG